MLDHPAAIRYRVAMKLGGRLRQARKRRAMTQETLSSLASTKEAPISQATISALESRDSQSSIYTYALAKALRINPEWLQTGRGDSGLDQEAWRPSHELAVDEEELLRNYRNAAKRWRLSLLLMSRLRGDDEQDEVSEGMNTLLAKISATPVEDARLGTRWTRPDKVKKPQ